jgi:hypothetical protein
VKGPIAQARALLLAHPRELRAAVRAPDGSALGLVRRPSGWWWLLWRTGEARLGANGAAALEALRTLAGVPDPDVEPTAANARQVELM